MVDVIEMLYHELKTLNEFCYLGDRINTGGGYEAVVAARARIGW